MIGFMLGIYVIINILVLFYYGFWNLDKKKINKLGDLEIIDVIACFLFPLLGVFILLVGIIIMIYNFIIDKLIQFIDGEKYEKLYDKTEIIKNSWKQNDLYKLLHKKIKGE
jgi:hypothetical protein